MQICTWNFLIVFHYFKDRTVSMIYNFLCNLFLLPCPSQEALLLPRASPYISPCISAKSEFFAVLRTNLAVLHFYFLPTLIPLSGSFSSPQRYNENNWKHTIWWDKAWLCLLGGNAFENHHFFLPVVFHVSEIFVPCKAILQITVLLSTFKIVFYFFNSPPLCFKNLIIF